MENGANWVGHLLHQLELAYRRMPQNFEEHPVEVFRRNVYVNPFWEDDVEELVDLITSSTCSSVPTTRIPRGSRNRSTTSITSPGTRASTSARYAGS